MDSYHLACREDLYTGNCEHPNAERIIDVCGNCRQLVDASENEPFTLVECPCCGVQMRVRSYFHHFQILEQVGTGGMSRVP